MPDIRSTCPGEDQLVLYHYRELPTEEVAAIGRHLTGCASCQLELESIAKVVEAFPAPAPLLSPSETAAFTDRVTARVGTRRLRPAWALAPLAAAALMLTVMMTPRTVPDLPPATRMSSDLEMFQDFDLLLDLELLQNLEALEALEGGIG